MSSVFQNRNIAIKLAMHITLQLTALVFQSCCRNTEFVAKSKSGFNIHSWFISNTLNKVKIGLTSRFALSACLNFTGGDYLTRLCCKKMIKCLDYSTLEFILC